MTPPPAPNSSRWSSGPIRFLIDLARFGGRRLITDNAPEMAAALAYRTIFSLIPVLVLALVLFKAFLGEQGMRRVLADLMDYTGLNKIQLRATEDGSIGPVIEENRPWFVGPPSPASITSGPETSDEPEAPVETARLTDAVEQFVSSTVERIQKLNSGLIAVVGILVLIYAALSLVIQVEQAFNTICRAPTGRSLRARLTSYTALLVLGPLFLMAGFFFSQAGVEWARGMSPLAATPLSLVARFGITWILMLIAYCWMPNARIKLHSAAVGALLAAVLWEGAKSLLTAFVAYLANPETGGQIAVYGSLALLPIFLTWVYITWLIVLFGFEVTFAVQTVLAGRHLAIERESKLPIIDPTVGVVLVGALAEHFAQGRPATADELARRCGLAEITAERVLDQLGKSGFVHRVAVPQDADLDAYTLARPPESITAADILAAMHALAGDIPTNGSLSNDASVLRLLRESQIEALRAMKISTLGSSVKVPPS